MEMNLLGFLSYLLQSTRSHSGTTAAMPYFRQFLDRNWLLLLQRLGCFSSWHCQELGTASLLCRHQPSTTVPLLLLGSKEHSWRMGCFTNVTNHPAGKVSGRVCTDCSEQRSRKGTRLTPISWSSCNRVGMCMACMSISPAVFLVQRLSSLPVKRALTQWWGSLGREEPKQSKTPMRKQPRKEMSFLGTKKPQWKYSLKIHSVQTATFLQWVLQIPEMKTD